MLVKIFQQRQRRCEIFHIQILPVVAMRSIAFLRTIEFVDVEVHVEMIIAEDKSVGFVEIRLKRHQMHELNAVRRCVVLQRRLHEPPRQT